MTHNPHPLLLTPAYLKDTHNSSTCVSLCLDPRVPCTEFWFLFTLTFPCDICLELHTWPAKRPDWLHVAKGSRTLSPWSRHRQNDSPSLQQSSLPLRLHSEIRAKAKQNLLTLQGSIVKNPTACLSQKGGKEPSLEALGDCLGEEDQVLQIRCIVRLEEKDGWTKRGSASEFFIPKQEETRKRGRDTVIWNKKRMADKTPRAEVWSLES